MKMEKSFMLMNKLKLVSFFFNFLNIINKGVSIILSYSVIGPNRFYERRTGF